MNFFHMKQLRFLLAPLLLTCLTGNAQQQFASSAAWHNEREGHPTKSGNTINSNVPLNEIDIHAYRHFQKMYPRVSGEYWFKTAEGYIVSFEQNSFRNKVHFGLRGNYLYSAKYYGEKDLQGYTGMDIKKKYPDYRIGVVTEITNGNKTFYLLKIENHSSVKTISVIDGKMEVVEDLVNGG
jgi:hypothetical protein